MLGFGWLTLRQAQEALNAGRLEEAQRLLALPAVQGHRKAGPLLQQLARGLAERGERKLEQDDIEAAWRNLLQAEQLGTAEKSVERLRQALTRLGLAQVRGLLLGGEPSRASTAIGQLRNNGVRHPELQSLEDATRNWLVAQELAERGDFGQALEVIARMQKALLGPSAALEQFRQSLTAKSSKFGELLGRLHDALERARWREALEAAELILAVAPQHLEARKARARAWKAIEPVTVAMRPNVPLPREAPVLDVPEPSHRFCLWVDGVGGYLLCLDSRVTLGQAWPEAVVDVPLIADISRLHATLTRDRDGAYLLEASRPVLVNGKSVSRQLLRSGDRITLGSSCQLLFTQPVPVSVSARLDLVSGHRVPLGVDAVILMADTLVLGSAAQVHVPMPDLKQTLVLHRNKESLGVRYPGNLVINGQKFQDRATLPPQASVVGEDFSLALEPATKGKR